MQTVEKESYGGNKYTQHRLDKGDTVWYVSASNGCMTEAVVIQVWSDTRARIRLSTEVTVDLERLSCRNNPVWEYKLEGYRYGYSSQNQAFLDQGEAQKYATSCYLRSRRRWLSEWILDPKKSSLEDVKAVLDIMEKRV